MTYNNRQHKTQRFWSISIIMPRNLQASYQLDINDTLVMECDERLLLTKKMSTNFEAQDYLAHRMLQLMLKGTEIQNSWLDIFWIKFVDPMLHSKSET